VSLLTTAHRCLCPYVGAGHHSQAVLDGHGWFWVYLCMWVVVVVGQTWVVVGVRHCVMVVVGGVIGLWLVVG